MLEMYVLILALIGAALFLLVLKRDGRDPACKYPPGPPADPWLGHLRVMPLTNQGRKFQEWSKQYGDVLHLRVLGRSIVVLNSIESALDLLDKRGAIYSLRPPFPIFFLMGWERSLSFHDNTSPLFVNHRRILQKYLGKREVETSATYQEAQRTAARVLIRDLRKCSSDGRGTSHWDSCFKKFSVSIITQIAYGHQIESDDDWYLKLSDDVLRAVDNAGPMGNTIVDQFPILARFPSWFPGTYYASYARECIPAISALLNEPVKRFMNAKDIDKLAAESIIISELMDIQSQFEGKALQGELHDIKSLGGTLYSAGGDTTWASMGIFVLAMLQHPDVLVKAREELDRVVGSERLPDFQDRPNTPYIEAILLETLRWHVVVPLGIPHRTVQDDTYKGMRIPKDSIVIANAVAINHDERVYHDPEAFNPERFLSPPFGRGEPHPTASFGFGRRACPGRYLAEASIWLGIAYLLSVFDILPALDEDGQKVTPRVEYTNGLASHVAPFPCRISLRSDREKLFESELSQ